MTADAGGAAAARAPLSRAQVEAILTELGAWKDGKQARPLTRADVDRLMANNAKALGADEPTGRGLPLRYIAFEEVINLGGTHLEGADLEGALLEGAFLWDVHLEGACLVGALLKSAFLLGAHLEGADLLGAHLEGADLRDAHLEGAQLARARLDTMLLEGVTWGSGYVVPEERWDYGAAEQVYRALKRAHQSAGIYHVADQFAYREQVCRKRQAWEEKRRADGAWLQFAELLFGYGYRWRRVVGAAAIVLVGFWLLYWGLGLGAPAGGPPPVLHSLYFSAVSFTAVGYGAWVSTTGADLGWPKYLGAGEAIAGVFLMALFLVTFTRQYLR